MPVQKGVQNPYRVQRQQDSCHAFQGQMPLVDAS
jgi:hypothetical protein